MNEADNMGAAAIVDNRLSDHRLRREWTAAVLATMAAIGVGFGALSAFWSLESALRWLLLTLPAGLYVLGTLRKGINAYGRRDPLIMQKGLGWANRITLLRGILICLLAGFVFQPAVSPRIGWITGIVYTLAVAMDYMDGRAARAFGRESRLGGWLDTQMDAFGLLVATFAAVWYDRLPVYCVAAGLAYYILRLGIRWRETSGRKTAAVKPYPAARMLAGLQMGLVAAALFPVLPKALLSVVAPLLIVPFLAGFVRDWLVATGSIPGNRSGIIGRRRR